MDRDSFWQHVGAARAACDDPGDVDEVADALTDLLCRGDEEEAAAFGRVLEDLVGQADRAGLRSVLPDPADDVLRSFCGWLVVQGREAFEQALPVSGGPLDPEGTWIGRFLEEDPDGEAVFEAPYDAWGRIVGDEAGYAEALLR